MKPSRLRRTSGRLPKLLLAGAALGGLALLLRRALAPSLAGKVVLVTGGSRGLGIVLARELARQGARLVLCARDAHELEGARDELVRRGAEVMPLVCDVSQAEEVRRAVAETEERMGRIDVLINNAGIIQVAPAETLALADYRNALDANYWGQVHMALAVLPAMRARRSGSIVNITSIGGAVAVPHLLAYSSSKFAAAGFSEGLAAEVSKDGVRVTTVMPGLMRTGSFVNALFKGRREEEFLWFALSSVLPLISMPAEHAARRILLAARLGERHLTLGLPAKVLRLGHSLLPGLTSRLMGLINSALLPSADGARASDPAEPGFQHRGDLDSGFLIDRGNRDAQQNREVPWAPPRS